MPDRNRLLVPIDGSDRSMRALAHVIKRAASDRQHPRLFLLNVHRRAFKAEIMVRVGEPGESIVKVARQKRCGEIVLGSRGLGNFKGLILGSVTTKVIHAARVPVTVIP